jgi:hypothetical protein
MSSSAARGLDAYRAERPEALLHACAALHVVVADTPWPLRSAAMIGARIHSVVAAGDGASGWFTEAALSLALRFTAQSGWRSDLLDAALSYSLLRGWLLRSPQGFVVAPDAPTTPGRVTAVERAALRFSAGCGAEWVEPLRDKTPPQAQAGP